MDNILQDIIKCEQDSLRQEEDAKKQALEIIANARKKAADLKESSLIEGETVAEDILEKANQNTTYKQNSEPDGQIAAVSQKKLEAAVNLIVERVVNKPWQW